MKAISLYQPWAWLVAAGEKAIETRSWGTNYRGQLAIHATQAYPLEGRQLTESAAFDAAVKRVREAPQMHRGAVLAIAELADCQGIHTLDDIRYLLATYGRPNEADFGKYEPGRYAWILRDVRPLKRPLTVKGAMGLWEWDPPALVVADGMFAVTGRVERQEPPR